MPVSRLGEIETKTKSWEVDLFKQPRLSPEGTMVAHPILPNHFSLPQRTFYNLPDTIVLPGELM